jgi:hypothetical protein
VSATLAEVLRTFGPAYLNGHDLSTAQARAWRAIVACRTPALGGKVQQCDQCGREQRVFHSCRNRHCPQCQSGARDAWRQAQLAELLPVPYCHLVFTLPHALNGLAQFHARWVYRTLMQCAAATLTEFAANPRGSRALLGMTRLVNSRFFSGNMHLQALSAPFTIWADGVTNPIMEEMPSTRALMALDLDDREGRARLMADPAWMAQFRHDWYRGRRGFDGARLRALIGMPLDNFSRELADVDMALLTDELPPQAFADPGFIQFLQKDQ